MIHCAFPPGFGILAAERAGDGFKRFARIDEAHIIEHVIADFIGARQQSLQRIGTGFGLLVTGDVSGIGRDQDEIVELFHLIGHGRFHGV